MGGFRLGRTYVLQFEGALEGAEVRIRATPVSVIMRMMGSLPFPEIADLMVEYVESWNLESPDGDPIKLEQEAILAGLERAVLQKILGEWYKAAAGITAPLDGPSISGGQSPVESIPMDVK